MPTLHWLTRNDDTRAAQRVPYRLLEEIREHSVVAPDTGNMLIQGDNLEALKALLPFYAGRVKCIYIDPPYNTRYAFQQYDDNLEHTKWLGLMWPRLELLRDFLAEDGSVWISIDDREGHYLKVICDEVFGRPQFMGNIVWQKRYSRDGREALGDAHEHVLCYAADPKKFKKVRNFLPLSDKQKKIYWNPTDDPRGPWQSVSLLAQGYRPNQMYEIIAPNGRVHTPPSGNCWKVIEPEFKRLIVDNRIYFGQDGNGVPRRVHFLKDAKGLVPWTWWPHDDAGHTGEAKNEINVLFGADNSFDTPKPERLIRQILTIATNPGDLVLDSFLGSGTTAAVAHKMGRRYIGIEMGDHAVTHCAPRLQKVIEGEQGGISKSVGWACGGGFRFYRLGPPVFDEDGHIRGDIRFSVLASHIWFSETHRPWDGNGDSPFLGLHDGHAFALLYNGILGDRRPGGGNVLTRATLALIRDEVARVHPDFVAETSGYPLTVYGERSRLTAATLAREGIAFKQTPYDVKARA